MKQIFGYTEIGIPEQGRYVRFITASDLGGSILLSIRDSDGRQVCITLPAEQAGELACQLNTAVFNHLPTARQA